jgi:RNA polymerase sigma-70 factor (ECF subfamily)
MQQISLSRKDDAENDFALLARIRAGDADAFAFLVRRHAERCYRVAYRFTANRQEAEDIVQNAFVKLWEQPDIWQDNRGATFFTWFTRIIINRCLDLKRRKVALPLEVALHAADGRILADEALIARQQKIRLEKEIAGLPERQRVALNLCFYEEFSNKDAASIMRVTVKGVQSLLMRAKTSLKERMQGEDYE